MKVHFRLTVKSLIKCDVDPPSKDRKMTQQLYKTFALTPMVSRKISHITLKRLRIAKHFSKHTNLY